VGTSDAFDAASPANTVPLTTKVTWGCCSDTANYMTGATCATAVHPNASGAPKPYEGLMWFGYAEHVTAKTGVFPGTLTPVSGTDVTRVYHNDILMVALNQLSDGTVCNIPKTVVNVKADPQQTFTSGATLTGKDKCSHLIQSVADKGFGLHMTKFGTSSFQLHFLEFSSDGYTATTGLMQAATTIP